MASKFYPGERVRRKTDGRTGKVYYSAFNDSREYPVAWDDTKSIKFVPADGLERVSVKADGVRP